MPQTAVVETVTPNLSGHLSAKEGNNVQSEPIISVSGLRGIIGQQLTPAVAVNYVSALAATLPKGRVLIGRDGRASGKIISKAVASALAAHGLDPIDLDVVSTPTVGVEVRKQEAVAAVQISASHNPKTSSHYSVTGNWIPHGIKTH